MTKKLIVGLLISIFVVGSATAVFAAKTRTIRRQKTNPTITIKVLRADGTPATRDDSSSLEYVVTFYKSGTGNLSPVLRAVADSGGMVRLGGRESRRSLVTGEYLAVASLQVKRSVSGDEIAEMMAGIERFVEGYPSPAVTFFMFKGRDVSLTMKFSSGVRSSYDSDGSRDDRMSL